MYVDLLLWILIERLETVREVLAPSLDVSRRSREVWEVARYWRSGDLLLEHCRSGREAVRSSFRQYT